MSSIENMVLNIQEEYRELMNYIGSVLISYDKGDKLNKDDLKNILRLTFRFQRLIEYILTRVKDIDESKSYKRLVEIFERIKNRFVSDKVFEKISKYPYSYNVKGVIVNLRESIHYIDRTTLSNNDYGCFYCAYISLRDMEIDLIEFQEELRYISLLNALPVEKTIKLKQILLTNEFEEVVFSLEEAESNIEIKHWKDVVSRCRDALEMFIYIVYKKEFNKEPTKYFSKDLRKIIKAGIFDEPTQRIILGIWGLLSLKGSHKYDDSKITPYDVEVSLKETYSGLELLLNKYTSHID